MKLIVGLGNPGAKYKITRHNVGFMLADILAKDLDLDWHQMKALKSEVAVLDKNLIIAKPQTSMNNSGLAVGLLVRKYHLTPADILVVYDDIDMELGKLRWRSSGSSGGHHGMQSIINVLGTNEIARLKIGIGRSANISPERYVLTVFSKADLTVIKLSLLAGLQLINQKFLAESLFILDPSTRPSL